MKNKSLKTQVAGLSYAVAALSVILCGVAGGCMYSRLEPRSAATPTANQPIPIRTLIASTVGIEVGADIQGTGLLVTRPGRVFVWTAAHVIQGVDPETITITQRLEIQHVEIGRTRYKVKVLRADLVWDLALLEVTSPIHATGATFRWGLPLEVGEPVLHVGNLLGAFMESSVMRGYVSKLERKASAWSRPLDQLDITALPGSSGGPVFDSRGHVVGLVVGKLTHFDGVSFMVPVRDMAQWARENRVEFAIYGAL